MIASIAIDSANSIAPKINLVALFNLIPIVIIKDGF